ncbi:hypothetical protein Sipo8835_00305 [Streptomyces ipomoeae]|uniref:Tat pathway signal sequence domain protein n=2 Tax=Streptomyces ipomoeae TaxID=103232 RepID=L1L4N1_9ACTN|nr:hypothetical protein [Streptomyces ipomoeae]EKX67568.1 hypothetical protein STRIP9103_06834 [Streptomyces ipomoeae 91-03]MDX2700151.1 hypothetical protein [Streptomyces ipomoeae]MDX2827747.1 hypothetical protein [Streptomyces ipomoeae]MDX2845817.1 hypothetical protein [Streptomyces ipomoeae]MDX2880087.1 hypothetical protein [Streptomyces ipomoeae]
MKRQAMAICAAASALLVLAGSPADASVHRKKPAGWSCDFDDWCTKNTRSGPGSAHVVYWFRGDFYDTLIRTGNASYGIKHIQQGGSHKRKQNHPTDSAAVKLWDKALNNYAKGSKGSKYKDTMTHTYKYGRGKKARTMCVMTSDLHLKHGGKDYGRKGVLTAFWVKGHVGWKGCNKKFD